MVADCHDVRLTVGVQYMLPREAQLRVLEDLRARLALGPQVLAWTSRVLRGSRGRAFRPARAAHGDELLGRWNALFARVIRKAFHDIALFHVRARPLEAHPRLRPPLSRLQAPLGRVVQRLVVNRLAQVPPASW